MSYWYQYNEVLNTRAKSVLEVGIGNGTVSNYLKMIGLEVTTVDIDPRLKPDYICSVTELSRIFPPNSFDAVLCTEVLEHMPFEYFQKSIAELSCICKQFIIISLPYFRIRVLSSIQLPKLGTLRFAIKIPFPATHKFDGQHYWEIGKRGYPLKKIISILGKSTKIHKSFCPFETAYHLFFILGKK